MIFVICPERGLLYERITHVDSAESLASRIYIGPDAHLPDATYPGAPSNFSGILAIVNNDIDLSVKSGAQGIVTTNDSSISARS